MSALPLVLVFVAFGWLLWRMRRELEVFALRVSEGRVTVLRGRPPAALMEDFRDVLRGAPDAEVRVVIVGGAPSLVVRGPLSTDTTQRLRNVLGRFPKSRLGRP